MYSPRLEPEGIKINGRTFKDLEVFHLCRDFGSGNVLSVCTELDLLPFPENIKKIRDTCQKWEDSLL